jgi:1-acyl-sn-glycerol-3-phosphate acyltransferase
MKSIADRLFTFGFLFFFRIFFRGKIGSVRCQRFSSPLEVTPAVPVLLLANHVSWWDGFLLFYFSKKYFPEHQFRIVMGKEEWDKRRWLARLGVLPLNRESPSQLLTFFRAMAKQRSGNSAFCLGYFFEGKMTAQNEIPGQWLRGSQLLAERLAPIVVVPVGLFLDLRYQAQVSAYVRAGEPFIFGGPPATLSQVGLEVLKLNERTLRETTEAQGCSQLLSGFGWETLW